MKGETNIPHTMMRDGTPNGYAIITFNRTNYSIDWKVAGRSHEHRMNIHLPRGIAAGSEENPVLSVNFFNGSEKTELVYRIKDHTDWKKMTRTEMLDPYYAMLDERWNNLDKLGFYELWQSDSALAGKPLPGTRLPRPQACTHLWTAELGTDWPAGRHIIEVRVKDMFGRVFVANHTMRITEPEAAEK